MKWRLGTAMAEEYRGREIPEFLVNQIRRLYREGRTVSFISRAAGVCRNTVYRYIKDQVDPKRGE